jgi:RNAse (barnase) inhibitor barstar
MTQSSFLQSDKLHALLTDSTQAGVYHMPHVDPAPLTEAAAAAGFAVFSIDMSQVQKKSAMLDVIARAMRFPEWFGQGFDALADCLSDLAWLPAEGYVVVLEHCDGIHGHAEADFVTMLQVFENVAIEWREQGVAFWCFVDMQADGINWLPDME